LPASRLTLDAPSPNRSGERAADDLLAGARPVRQGAAVDGPTERLDRPHPDEPGRPGPGDPWGPSIFTPVREPDPPEWAAWTQPVEPDQGTWVAPEAQQQDVPAEPPPAGQLPTEQLAEPDPRPQWAQGPAGPWGGPPAPRQPRGPGRIPVVVITLALVAGLLGGLFGSRLGRRPTTVNPVVNQVTASNKSNVDRVQAVAQNLLPVTVQIQVGTGMSGATGSGVIMSADGFVLTNNHVVEGAQTITVVLPNSEALRAKLVGADPSNDLAVVKVDRDDLPVANFGHSADLKVGELTVAVGSPFGLQGSVTAGIISALHRVVQIGEREQLVNAIQTDASINPGNSGGALANGAGQVIGINTAIATNGGQEANAGVGFAIPIDEALEIAKDLIAGRTIRTPLLGVRGGADLTPEVADQYGLKGRTGALIRQVEPSSPADRAGMRSGDLVIRIAGDQVHGWDELVVAVRRVDVGQTVPVVVVRGGKELTLQVTPTDKQP
jgi:putative serine protease PepD